MQIIFNDMSNYILQCPLDHLQIIVNLAIRSVKNHITNNPIG
jgi:hypothetical protein